MKKDSTPYTAENEKLSKKQVTPEDKREKARHEHTNHFTNRANQEKK